MAVDVLSYIFTSLTERPKKLPFSQYGSRSLFCARAFFLGVQIRLFIGKTATPRSFFQPGYDSCKINNRITGRERENGEMKREKGTRQGRGKISRYGNELASLLLFLNVSFSHSGRGGGAGGARE